MFYIKANVEPSSISWFAEIESTSGLIPVNINREFHFIVIFNQYLAVNEKKVTKIKTNENYLRLKKKVI